MIIFLFILAILQFGGISSANCYYSDSHEVLLPINDQLVKQHELKSLGLPKEILNGRKINRERVTNVPFFDEKDQEVYLRDYKGNIIVLVFWASWNIDSAILIKELGYVQKYLKDQEISGIKILPISVDYKNPLRSKLLYQNYNMANVFEIYIDKNHNLIDSLSITSIPTTLIIDKNNFVITQIKGYMRWYNLDIINYLISLVKEDNLYSNSSN